MCSNVLKRAIRCEQNLAERTSLEMRQQRDCYLTDESKRRVRSPKLESGVGSRGRRRVRPPAAAPKVKDPAGRLRRGERRRLAEGEDSSSNGGGHGALQQTRTNCHVHPTARAPLAHTCTHHSVKSVLLACRHTPTGTESSRAQIIAPLNEPRLVTSTGRTTKFATCSYESDLLSTSDICPAVIALTCIVTNFSQAYPCAYP